MNQVKGKKISSLCYFLVGVVLAFDREPWSAYKFGFFKVEHSFCKMERKVSKYKSPLLTELEHILYLEYICIIFLGQSKTCSVCLLQKICMMCWLNTFSNLALNASKLLKECSLNNIQCWECVLHIRRISMFIIILFCWLSCVKSFSLDTHQASLGLLFLNEFDMPFPLFQCPLLTF